MTRSSWLPATPGKPPDPPPAPGQEPGALTTGPLRRTVLGLAIPAVAMIACNFSFNFIDTIWVGRLIGPAALAAVSTAGFYVWVALNLGEMVEIGVTAVAARRHGERDPERAAQVGAAAVIFAVILGFVVAVIGLAVMDPMLRFMAVPADVAALGREYLSTWLLGCPLVFGFFAMEATFRASGDTRTPFLVLAGSVAVSIALDPLLIAGVGPFPQLGVEGAALASLMVRGGGFVLGLIIALRRRLLRFSAPDWRSVPTVVRIGMPLSLAGVLLSVIYMWLTRFTSQFGTPALAALGIGHKMEGLGFIAISGFSLAAGALVGQNLGAGQESRAREAVRLTVIYCLMVTVTTAIAFLAIPAELVSLFTRDPEVVRDGVLYLRVIALAQIGQSFELILEGAMAGAGYAFWPQIASTSLTALRIPLAAWWSRSFGLIGIWVALSATAIARGIAMILFWKGGRWRAGKA